MFGGIEKLYMLLWLTCACNLWHLGVTKHLSEGEFKCGEGKFKCSSEKCIPHIWQCDGDNDCGDGSDEVNCAPATCRPYTEFGCRNGKCIPSRWTCDSEKDCFDGSDEESCSKPSCQPNFFQCNNTRCIRDRWKCDLQDDCGDNSDEAACGDNISSCKSNEFKCADNSCISNLWVCDANKDCSDGSDEKDCKDKIVICAPEEFSCTNNHCIPQSWHCDGNDDCEDRSDEMNCTYFTIPAVKTCGTNFWRCNNGDCIRSKWQCDGEKDCADNSDEDDCSKLNCSSSKFSCKDHQQCIFKSLECDGAEDCTDGSDERNCKKPPLKCGAETFNCTDGSCISYGKVCDLRRDCTVGEDEPVNCFLNECAYKNGHCMHNCTDLKIGYKCSCAKGYKLSSDERSCEDENECNSYGTCHQLCTNTKGHYKCSCSEGYELERDRKSCKATGLDGIIYFANRHDIRKVKRDSQEYDTAVNGLKGVVSFDFHIQNNQIYWTDVISETIQRTVIGKTNTSEIVLKHVHTPDGLAIDWITGKMYWTDTGYKTIEVADIHGQHNMDIVDIELNEPRAISVDPHEGFIYWSDWGNSAAIEKISMDGMPESRVKLISENIEWPNGLTLDLAQRRLYWIDAKLKRVEVADFNGKNRQIVKQTGFQHPFALDQFEDMLYWTDWQLDGVNGMSKFNPSEIKQITSGLYAPMDVKVLHPSRQRKEKNPCGKNNFGCSHLCLLANHYGRRIVVCKCPRNMTLEGKTCIGKAVTRGPRPRTTPILTEGPQSTTAALTKLSTSTSTTTTHQLSRTKSSAPAPEVIPNNDGTAQRQSHPTKASSSMAAGTIAAVIISVVIGIILILFFVCYIKRKRMNKSHVMFYKDMSTAPLEDDFDIEHEDLNEKAKIISDNLEEL